MNAAKYESYQVSRSGLSSGDTETRGRVSVVELTLYLLLEAGNSLVLPS